MTASRYSILFGNDPQSYRQTLAAVVGTVRQEIEAIVVAPEELDEYILRGGRSCLVVCSRLTEAIKATVADWILLYPGGEGRVEINCGGKHESFDVFDLNDFLAAIDAAVACLTGGTLDVTELSPRISSL